MGSEGAPSLSVVIVTRNRREDLLHSLSLLRQQDSDFELVVVDNGSQDGSPEAVRAAWPGAVQIRLPENLGSCGGRNRGLAAASGEILVCVDDDAAFRDPDALSRIRRRFAAEPGLGIVATTSRLAATGEVERACIPRRDKREAGAECAVSHFDTVGCAIRREVLERAGPFREDYVYGCEELDLGWRALACDFRIRWIPDLVVVHRHSPLERPPGRFFYANARDRVRLALRHLPWVCVLSYAALWWPWLLLGALRHGMLPEFFRGLRDGLALLRPTWRERRPLPRSTVRAIGALGGRLWY